MSPESSDGEAIVQVRDLRKSFGGIVAVDGASFDLNEGQITGLIGPNGAGKTTTFNLLSGFYRPDGGTISFRGDTIHELMQPSSGEQRIWVIAAGGTTGGAAAAYASSVGLSLVGMGAAAIGGVALGSGIYFGQQVARSRVFEQRPSRPFRLTRAGMARTFQITRELENMTVLENLMLGPQLQKGEQLFNNWIRPGAIREQEQEIMEQAMETLELLELTHVTNEPSSNLSGGQRKLLELGRILMTDPDVILLDEPVAGVNPALRDNLLERIIDLKEAGYTFCVVEHDMDVIMNISDNVIVMNQGDVLVEGPPSIIREDQRVIDAYLGE